MKGYGFRLVEVCEGVGENLSFRSLINLKGATEEFYDCEKVENIL